MMTEDIASDLEEIRNFIWNDDDGEDGSPRRSADGRTRDFIIGKDHNDHLSQFDYELGEVDLPPDTLDLLHEFVHRKISGKIGQLDANKVSVAPYGEGTGDREYIKHISSGELPVLGEFEQIFDENDIPSKRYESLDPDFQAIRIKGPDKLVIAFQHYWGNQLLGNTSLFNFLSRRGDFEKVEDPIIAVPKRLDAVYYDETLYIFNDWRFEQIFDYHREYEKVAQEVIDSLRDGEIEFEDMDWVANAVTDNPNMMRKINDVQQNGAYEDLSMDDVKWVIDQHPDALEGVDVVSENGERKISVRNKLDVWGLIHILNDDHVVSELADRVPELDDRVYRASSKEEIS